MKIVANVMDPSSAANRDCLCVSEQISARRRARQDYWVRAKNVPVVSAVPRVRWHKLVPTVSMPHRVQRTWGEQKRSRTVLPTRVDFGLRRTADLPVEIFERHKQVGVGKRFTDTFRHNRIGRLTAMLPVWTFVVCGSGAATRYYSPAMRR